MNAEGRGGPRLFPPRIRSIFWLKFAVASLAGAALIHVVEYHLGLGFSGDVSSRLDAMAYMIAHCPMGGPLLAVGLGSAGAVAVTSWVMARQLKRLRDLEPGLSDCSPGWVYRLRRAESRESSSRPDLNPPRLVLTSLLLAFAQSLLFLLALHFVPMQYVMEMRGGRMLMAVTLPVPVLPLTLVIGAMFACLLEMLEGKVELLASAIERLRALFGEVRSSVRPVVIDGLRPVVAFLGPALFSRPPPLILVEA